MKKKVSIVIPLYNCEEFIDACLQGVLQQNYPKNLYEIIVVDHNSTDKSAEIVNQYDVTLVSFTGGTIAGVRNYGSTYAEGDIIGFVDSDSIISPNWVKEAIQLLSTDQIGAAGADHILGETALSWVEKAFILEPKVPFRYVSFVPSGNMVVKHDVFKSVGGFDESLETCEDADLCERIIDRGYKVVHATSLKSIHLRNYKTIPEMFKKEMWYGKNMMISLKNRKFDLIFLFTFLFALFHAGIFLAILIGKLQWSAFSLGLLTTLLIIATIKRITISRKYSKFFHILILYYVYFGARATSLLINAFKPLKKN